MPRLCAALLACWSLALAALARAEDAPSAEAPSTEAVEFFETHVRPVLAAHCTECHGAAKQEAGLRLDTRAGVLAGSANGAVVVEGQPDESRLVSAVRRGGDVEMPPNGRLPDEAIAALAEWVARGLPWPADAAAILARRPTDPEAIAAARQEHWAYRPVTLPEVPQVAQDASDGPSAPLTTVDRFLVARLQAAGLTPSPPADRRTLLRRATFDLIGLPPTREEIAAFEADADDDAFARVVERLLASPQYGERWGRHWLDVARYADTKGYVFTEERKYPFAYTYRDYVIRAFNEDLPYDRFLTEQIAADQLPLGEDTRPLAAMGFLTLGRRFLNNQHDIIDDRIDVVMRGTQALTVACARCHDHKYDPIPTEDYYSLHGVFVSSMEPEELPAIRAPGVEDTGLRAMALVDRPDPEDSRIFRRGSPGNRGDVAPRRFLAVLSPGERPAFQQGSGRLELAQRIASRDNPLTARVLVNRVWMHHFGEGLVRSVGDFGARGEAPSHPELLDYLAWTFMERGWSIKALHREIMLSRAYRQRSDDRPDCAAVDPENRLLWRFNRQRLDFEALRDSLLSAAGRLDLTQGGPSVELTSEPFATRRTVYGFVDRQNLPGLFRTFDFASPDTSTPRRHATTIPQQALFMLNGPFVLEQARGVAARPEMTAATDGATVEDRVRLLYELVLGRAADAEELVEGTAFIAEEERLLAERAAPWQFGYGRYDEESQRTAEFQALPHFTGRAWQGGPDLPDPKLGWASLHRAGGHPGENPGFAAIRRLTVTRSGTVNIVATLQHADERGDGVRARIVSSRGGLLGEWSVQKGTAATELSGVSVEAGETLDFVVDCRASTDHDSFRWAPVVRLVPAGEGPEALIEWSAAAAFDPPRRGGLDPWEKLAQVLLLSNEFAFVD